MEWTEILRYEFVTEVQTATDFLVKNLPLWQQRNGPVEACWTWEEVIEGVPYIVNLCVNTLQNSLYGG